MALHPFHPFHPLHPLPAAREFHMPRLISVMAISATVCVVTSATMAPSLAYVSFASLVASCLPPAVTCGPLSRLIEYREA